MTPMILKAAALFAGVVVLFVFVISLIIVIRETRKRQGQGASLMQALLRAHVVPPLGEFEVELFGSIRARLRVYDDSDSGNLSLEVTPCGLLAYSRSELEIPSAHLAELARLLRQAAAVT